MALREYYRKRDFARTPEPAGKDAAGAAGHRFVVQKHDASRLHYDFRLELDGSLKSWAVPKGPSLDPAVKSLAVQVEDHPLEYADFEGIIPQGQYGGGTVMVWDQGKWTPEGDAAHGFRQGKLKFQLEGEKLHCGWSLVRMGGRAGEDGENWLLIKHRDKNARAIKSFDLLTKEAKSVLSGRTMDQIAAAADRVLTSKGEAPANRSPGRRTQRTTAASKKNATGAKNRPVARAPQHKREPVDGRCGVTAAAVARLPGARLVRQPAQLKPQLATLATEAPRGELWLHELKFDGYRILAFIDDGRVRLVTRSGNDWTRRFSALADAVAKLPVRQAILDGEVVALDSSGITDFQRLQNAIKRGDADSLVLYLFDVPHCAGYDLTATPLLERKTLLSRLIHAKNPTNAGLLRYSDHVLGDGATVIEQACRQAMEGIVSKRVASGYAPYRTRDWLKVKCTKRQEFVIGGFTRPAGSRVGFGALLLGFYDGGRLVYCGRVGTGFTDESLRQLAKELKSRRADECPFAGRLTAAQRKSATWIRPELVCEVEFTEWTEDCLLRHPSFQGLREDKLPREIIHEEAVAMPRNNNNNAEQPATRRASQSEARSATRAGQAASDRSECTVAGVHITHPDRIVYPEQSVTKCDLANYYAWIAPRMLPFVAGRPLTLVRCPAGPRGQCFYQKHLTGSLPTTVRGVMIAEKTGRDEYVIIDDAAGLVSLVQMGVLEMHPWPAREDNVERPDMLVFDLDPGAGTAWQDVVQAARDARQLLDELGLESFLRTSGGKGLHVVVPLVRRQTWEQLKAFAKTFADEMVRRAPQQYIATMSKAKRRGKVFVDYLRNQRGATAVATYSTRAREGAPVATPVAWDELSTRLRADALTVTNLRRRLERLKKDPWDGFFKVRQAITKRLDAKLAALARA